MSFTPRFNQIISITKCRILTAQECSNKMYYRIYKQTEMKATELTTDEIEAAKKIGINLKQFWAVCPEKNATPIAIFDDRIHAQNWKNKMCLTATVEPYALSIK